MDVAENLYFDEHRDNLYICLWIPSNLLEMEKAVLGDKSRQKFGVYLDASGCFTQVPCLLHSP